MSFIIDNLFYTLMCVCWIGRGIEFAKPDDVKVTSKDVTVLIPAKHETKEAMRMTVESINQQTIVPKIWIVLDESDSKTIKFAKDIAKEFDNVEIKVFDNKSKADALNKAVQHVTTKYVLIIDVGDKFGNQDAIENLLKVAEKGYEAVVSVLHALNGGKIWQTFVEAEMRNWTYYVLRVIKKKFGFIPLPGTGLLIRTDALRRNPFPETLAEDASLGLRITNVAITTSSILLYNIPERLRDHLKQRSRWMAGYLQTFKLAKGKKKLIFLTPFVQGLTTISLACMPITAFIGLYGFPWIIIDWIAGILLLYYIIRFYKLTKDKHVIILPLWWFIAGLSFYISLYYLIKKKWYFSPKSVY